MPNFFEQFDEGPQAQPQEKPNFFAQFDTPTGEQKTALPQINIPIPFPGGGSFKPSLIGMVQGLLEAGKSGGTLPRDVYQGKVDPLSEAGIDRAAELASMTMLPSAGRSLAVKPLTPSIPELRAAAKPTYEALTEAGNTIPVVGKEISTGIAESLHPEGLRMANAPRTYREINRLSGASDLNDVAIARDKLRDVANGISENKLIRVAGDDSKAARSAMESLDKKIDELSPGWTQQMKEADANWAASKRVEKVQKEAGKGEKGRLGSFDTNETRAKGYTKEEIAAIKKAHQGGMLGSGLNAIGAALNLFHGGISAAIPAALGIASHGASLPLIPVGMAADAVAKMLRQQALRQAMEKIASRSPLAQSRPGTGILQLPQISMPPTLGLLPLESAQRQ